MIRRLLPTLLLGLGMVGAALPAASAGRGRIEPLALPALHAEPDPVAGGRIVDARGREVLLRGVNVNAFVDYWAYDPALFTTYPFTPQDADAIAAIGWNVVRLLVSWSRVEPEPGRYDDAYLDEVLDAVRVLASRGVYTIVDLHQDAWGPSLAARPDQGCPVPPAFGWDGAPAWATLDGGAGRCINGARELSPAVLAAFRAFWADETGPGGVGIRTRYVRMLRHVAERFAPLDAVAGYDVMNEPNAFFLVPGQLEALADLYAEALVEIRAGERAVGAPPRLVLFEPAITWADFGAGLPPHFPHDDQIVYAPHLYQGGISAVPLSAEVFERARAEAALFGGAPILSGEWGADPRRASDPEDGYFERHQALQDAFRFGATLWTWREACGDPHKAGEVRDGRIPFVWGLFDVDCATNTVRGMREDLVTALRRPLLRAAPGPIDAVSWDPEQGVFEASGEGARRHTSFVVFVPGTRRGRPRIDSEGLLGVHRLPAPGEAYFVVGRARGGPWRVAIVP